MKYVTGSMISQEYSHQVSLARMPNWVAMYAMPPHSTQVVRRSAFLLSSSLTYVDIRQRATGQKGETCLMFDFMQIKLACGYKI